MTMYSQNVVELTANVKGVSTEIEVDETLEAEDIEVFAPADTLNSVAADKQSEDLRSFLVSCFLASVSIETMSQQLAIDTDTIRSELQHGIQAWNASQRGAVARTTLPAVAT